MKHARILGMLGVCLGLAGVACAGEAPAPQVENRVEIDSVRDPALMPYRKAWAFFQQLDAIPHDKLNVRFMITSKEPGVKPQDIRIHLVGEHETLPIPVSPEGFIELPRLPAMAEEDAAFVSNRKKGSLQLEIRADAILGSLENRSYADLLDAVGQLKGFYRFVTPWYFRLFNATPMDALRACYATPPETPLRLETSQGEVVLPLKGERHCVRIDLDEDRRTTILTVHLPPPSSVEFLSKPWFGWGEDD